MDDSTKTVPVKPTKETRAVKVREFFIGSFKVKVSIDASPNGGAQLLEANVPVLEFPIFVNVEITWGGFVHAKYFVKLY